MADLGKTLLTVSKSSFLFPVIFLSSGKSSLGQNAGNPAVLPAAEFGFSASFICITGILLSGYCIWRLYALNRYETLNKRAENVIRFSSVESSLVHFRVKNRVRFWYRVGIFLFLAGSILLIFRGLIGY